MRLSHVNLLEELAKPEHAELRELFVERAYTKGDVVFQPGEGPDQVFVVATGRVRIFLASMDKEFTLAILEPGAVYSTHTRAHVQAMEDCTLLVTETGRFHASLTSHPELTGAMINVLGGLLKNSFTIISGLVFRDVSRRLVTFLLDEAEENGRTGEDGSVLLSPGLTMEQMAHIVGSTRQTVSMLLNDLTRSGHLEKVERGTFLIPDMAAFRTLLD